MSEADSQPVAPVPGTPGPGTSFVRNSSGLVRQIGLRDAFILNFGWTGAGFSITLAFIVGQALWAYPGADVGLAQIITTILIVPTVALAYSLLSVVMPRAGGDYVFISRGLSPFLGFVASWGLMIMLAFFVAFGAYLGGANAIAAVAAILGHITGAAWLTHASTWMSTKAGGFVVGLGLTLFFAGATLAGVRALARINVAILALGLLGLVLGLIVMLVVGHRTFVGHFNSFMGGFTKDPNYYRTVLHRSAADGVHSTGFSIGATVKILPILAFSSIFGFGSAYVAGEVRDSRRVQLLSVPLALVALGVLNVLTYYLTRKLTGYAFLTGASRLYQDGKLQELTIPPYFNLFAAVATGSPVLAVLISIGYLMMSVLFIPMNILICTRQVFAWSFDGILPAKFAQVDSRLNSPIYAVALVTLLSVGFLAVLVYTTWLSTLSGLIGALPAFALACLAAAMLPKRRRALIAESPIAGFTFLGVPVIVIAGVLGAIYCLVMFIALLTNHLYLANSTTGLAFVAGTFAIGAIIFGVSWLVRLRAGFQPSKVFQEIPPA